MGLPVPPRLVRPWLSASRDELAATLIGTSNSPQHTGTLKQPEGGTFAAGAAVAPSEPKRLEPELPVPKHAEPPNSVPN